MESRVQICSLLNLETIELNLRSNDREALFAEMIQMIPGIGSRPGAKQTLLSAVVERERMHTTGIGDGLAIPHARNAIPGLIDHAVVVFGRHSRGVEYGAVDTVPVRLFFLLIAPSISEHLQILAGLSKVLRDPGLRTRLLKAGQPEEVIEAIRSVEARA